MLELYSLFTCAIAVALLMIPDSEQLRSRNFDFLKLKYHVDKHSSIANSDRLYDILERVSAGYDLIDSEQQWLSQNELFQTVEAIKLKEYQAQVALQMQAELIQLQAQYSVPTNCLPAATLYPLLRKLDRKHNLNSAEIEMLADDRLLELRALAKEIQNFTALKLKYEANAHPDFLPNSPLYQILQDWDLQQSLSDSGLQWLLEQNLLATVSIHRQQLRDRRKKADLQRLKEKYQVTRFLDCSGSQRLYRILQQLEAEKPLSAEDADWLRQKPVLKPLWFAHLKQEYGVTRFIEGSPECILFRILEAFEQQKPLSQTQVDWVEACAPELLEIAAHDHFAQLCRKYRIVQPPFEPFYRIMLKLEHRERLERLQVAELIDKELLSRGGEIAKAHHCLEAEFYEQEYRRTGNKWQIVSAVSEWRKAERLDRALTLTENLGLNKVSDKKLKGALLTNRGFVLRDDNKYAEAGSCAKQALEFNLVAFQPYLLMATLCYRQSSFVEGDSWKQKAIERGANLGDLDHEMKRLVKNTKDADQRQALVKYLLETDPHRYVWAKEYLKQS